MEEGAARICTEGKRTKRMEMQLQFVDLAFNVMFCTFLYCAIRIKNITMHDVTSTITGEGQIRNLNF